MLAPGLSPNLARILLLNLATLYVRTNLMKRDCNQRKHKKGVTKKQQQRQK